MWNADGTQLSPDPVCTMRCDVPDGICSVLHYVRYQAGSRDMKLVRTHRIRPPRSGYGLSRSRYQPGREYGRQVVPGFWASMKGRLMFLHCAAVVQLGLCIWHTAAHTGEIWSSTVQPEGPSCAPCSENGDPERRSRGSCGERQRLLVFVKPALARRRRSSTISWPISAGSTWAYPGGRRASPRPAGAGNARY